MSFQIDWSFLPDQVFYCCDQTLHWLLNDGFAFTAFLLFFFAASALVAFNAKGNTKQLTQGRAGYDIECFVRDMTASGYDANVARSVYLYIQRAHRIDFPILPADDLYMAFGITDDGVQRAMPTLMQATGRDDEISTRLRKPLNTVKDLVAYVESRPRTLEYVWEREHFQIA
jgi:hypothetical protein